MRFVERMMLEESLKTIPDIEFENVRFSSLDDDIDYERELWMSEDIQSPLFQHCWVEDLVGYDHIISKANGRAKRRKTCHKDKSKHGNKHSCHDHGYVGYNKKRRNKKCEESLIIASYEEFEAKRYPIVSMYGNVIDFTYNPIEIQESFDSNRYQILRQCFFIAVQIWFNNHGENMTV